MHIFQINALNRFLTSYVCFELHGFIIRKRVCSRSFYVVSVLCIYINIIVLQCTVRKTQNTKKTIYRNWAGPCVQGNGPLLGFSLLGTTLKHEYIYAPNRNRTRYPCYSCLRMIADSRNIRRCGRSDRQFEGSDFNKMFVHFTTDLSVIPATCFLGCREKDTLKINFKMGVFLLDLSGWEYGEYGFCKHVNESFVS
jgi:hypothetical protein